MMVFINGVIAQVTLSPNNSNGSFTDIGIGCGLAVMLGVHTAGGVSGAHLNPAISIAMAVYGKLPWKKVPFYGVAQFVGAFVAALVVFLTYYPALNAVDPYRTIKTAGVFATYPATWENSGSAFVNEVVGTSLLVFMVFCVDDPANMPTNPCVDGTAMNPARDLGPRVLTACAGWGSQVFTLYDYYWWVPITAPIVVAILGGGVYKVLLSNHHDQDDHYDNAPTTPVVV
ncbi:hypothetical protein LEN26_010045 [Aphanomyces euteiches]|nr:hypothetical protein LEN26_010045 [Aphanomyces euteiches]